MATAEKHETAVIGDLLMDMGRDVRRIAVDEIEIARGKLSDYLAKLVAKAAGAIVGMAVAMIGLSMLCFAAVAALAPVLPELWLRLVIMAAVFLVVGAGIAYAFMKKLSAMHSPDLEH